MEVDGSTLYWCEASAVDGNVVRSAPKDGSGPVRSLGSWFDFAFNRSLVLDATHVFWLTLDETGSWPLLTQVDKDGANPVTTRVPALDNVKLFDFGAIAGAPDAIFLATLSCSLVLRVPKDGSTIQSWAVSSSPDAGGATGFEVFGDFVYCSNGPYIHRLDPKTGAVSELVNSQNHAGPLAMIDGFLYFANNGGGAGDSENLARVRTDGGSAENLGPSFNSALRLLYDSTRHMIYWTAGLNFQTAGIAAYDLEASEAPVLLLDGQNVMGDSAADADYLYWDSDYAITRLHKP